MTGYQSKKAATQDKLAQPEQEALKLALEALKEIARHATTPWEDEWCGELANETLKAINALAQPAQKPDVVMHCDSHTWTINNPPPKGSGDVNLYYAAQPVQEPVCPECKAGVLYECVACSSNNYPPQGAQEPVAWMRPSEEGYDSAFRDHSTVMVCTGNPWTGWIPLYTAPPAAQRTWVDLTRTQIQNVYFAILETHRGGHQMEGQLAFGEALQAAIKEKNGG